MRVLFVTLAVVLLDQATKLAVKGFGIPFLNFTHYGMFHGERIRVFGDFFQFTFVENPGMAFSIEVNSSAKLWISIFSIVASIGLAVYLYSVRRQSLSLRLSLALILGGAIGNLIDRVFYGVFYGYAPLFYGKVVDFLDFDFFNIDLFGRSYERFPIFNIADTSVTIGVLLMLLFYKKHQLEMEGPAPEATATLPENAAESSGTETATAGSNATAAGAEQPEQSGDGQDNNRKDVQV